MKTTTKFSLLMFVLIVAIATVASQFLHVRLGETKIEKYTTNAGELTQDVLVGQTFVAQKDNLSGLAVMLATYSGRNNTQPVSFHLRESLEARTDLRSTTVQPTQLNDNQFHRFAFEPIPDSKGKTYFFFLTSPGSQPGDAITVDLNTQDPYFLGTAFVVRGAGPNITDPAILSGAGKLTADVVFETFHTVTLREAVFVKTEGYIRTFIGTWAEKRGTYVLWAELALPVLIFLVFVKMVRRYNLAPIVWLPILFFLAVGIRFWYARSLPITNDEGNYLYDAWTLLHGKLAGGDGYVKAPLVAVWIAVWEFIFGHSVIAGRLSSVAAGALTLFPLYSLGKNVFDQRTGFVTAAAWALFGPAIVFDVYVHTQPLSLFFGVSGLAVLLMGLKGTVPRASFLNPKIPAADFWFVLSGVLLGLGVASRKSILALGLVPILFVLTYGKSWRLRIQHVISVGVGFLLVIALFLGFALLTYGKQGVYEAIGINSAEDGINVAQEDAELIRAYSIRGMTPFFRESLALVWFAVIGLGIVGERAIRAGMQWSSHFAKATRDSLSRASIFLLDHFLPKLAWIIPILVFGWAWSFFNTYEGETFHILGIPWLWAVMGLGVLVLALLPRLQEDRLILPEQMEMVPKSTQPLPNTTLPTVSLPVRDFLPKFAAWMIGILWVFAVVEFYIHWIKFHANYIAEFIPPLILVAAPGVLYLFDRLRTPLFLSSDYPPIAVARKLLVAGTIVVIFWTLFTSSYITYIFEHTGTFQQGAVAEAAEWAKQYIPPDQDIFTGAAVVPYASGHKITLDIAHPRWYAYEFTRKDLPRINTFLPPAEDMVAAFHQAKWVLHDQQTEFSFLVEYEDIIQDFQNNFVAVKQIENGGNPLTFYQRVR